MSQNIFVFGSNLSGIHGAGAAYYARIKHGAVAGQGIGLQGTSYAIPTKDYKLRSLSLRAIGYAVEDFLNFAAVHPEMTFQVTRIGCGLAGYSDCMIAPMFAKAPKNCQFDEAWREYLGDEFTYWGTF